ncbi:MAG: ATPase, T2SS/T4P/T4SS family [Candidatus Omnitrophota bacterium]
MMNRQTEKLLADALVKNKVLSSEDAQNALIQAQRVAESFEHYLLRLALVNKEQILIALSAALNLATVDLRNSVIEKSVIERIPVRFVWYYKFMPVKIENRVLTLAVNSPLDIKVQDELRVHLGLEPKMVLALEDDIIDAIKKYYGLAADTIDRILSKDVVKRTAAASTSEKSVEDIEKKSEDASVIKLVNQIILEAYQKRATDIHIEPYRDKVRFRYRIDGVLVDANLPSEVKHFLLPILSRIKIMANLSIVEKRLPQDGSAVVKTNEQTLDLRISTIPTPSGESMVIRILPTKVMLFSLEKLGLYLKNVQIFRELIKKPHGIIFVTGPTGSGKTTTLYACLNEINSAERKIITIEDPIEYEMENVTQIQVSPKVNLTFAAGLRSVLRHDPDIIMVGEVRDLETAEIAIRTALTGHLVFSTLHTNDAASGVTRLIEMGLESYLVSSSIEAFVAQRLVRVICPNCKEQAMSPFLEIKKEISEALRMPNIDQIRIYQGRGCDQCNHTGFYGRTGIHEILVMDDVIKAAVLEKPRADHIKQLAMTRGMVTLRQDGWRKVIEGVTTPSEVMNVTTKEDYSWMQKEVVPQNEKVKKEIKTITAPMTADVPVANRVVSKEVLATENQYGGRIYPRAATKVAIRYKVFQVEAKDDAFALKGDNVEHSTATKNLSAGGLLFIAAQPMSVESILEVKIQLDPKQPSIDCLAKVCRVEEDDQRNTFNIAVYYLDITSADRVKISEFVKLRVPEKESTNA